MVVVFSAPGIVLLAIEPWTLPVAILCFVHAWAVPSLQARRGARSVVGLGDRRGAGAGQAPPRDGPEGVALGLLADLVGGAGIDTLRSSGLALHRGALGTWLVGEQGAFLVRGRGSRPWGGTRLLCWCVRVANPEGLPAADRIAHLLLALREDEEGFATVANLAFSGARWRVERHLPPPGRGGAPRALI